MAKISLRVFILYILLLPNLTNARQSYGVQRVPFDSFINHRGPDVKNTLASHIFHHLRLMGYTPFLDKYCIQIGENSSEAIQTAMDAASVFVTIFSPMYAESKYCMDELQYIVETGKPIIPEFYKISPSELQMEEADGVYARAFQEHAINFDPWTLVKWRDAFRKVSDIGGYVFNDSEDEGALVWRVGTRVSEYIGKPTRPASDLSGTIAVHATILCEPHRDKDKDKDKNANCFDLSITGTGSFAVTIRNPNLSLDILLI